MKNISLIFIILSMIFSLVSCGLKGPLYLPSSYSLTKHNHVMFLPKNI